MQVLSVDPIVVGQVVYSDGEGKFNLPLSPGVVEVRVSADGYEAYVAGEIQIVAGEENAVLIELSDD